MIRARLYRTAGVVPDVKKKFSNEDKLEKHIKNVHQQIVKKQKVNSTDNDQAPHITGVWLYISVCLNNKIFSSVG